MKRERIQHQLAPVIKSRLEELADANHCGAGSLVHVVEGAEIRARIAGGDRLACEVELISVTAHALNSMDVAELQELASRLAQQLSYLEERLVVLEIDRELPQIQMRSETPYVDDDVRSYFEVQVSKQSITLQRFSKGDGAARTRCAAILTREVFSRVCVDLVTLATADASN